MTDTPRQQVCYECGAESGGSSLCNSCTRLRGGEDALAKQQVIFGEPGETFSSPLEQKLRALREAALAVARRMYVYRRFAPEGETVHNGISVRESLEPCWCQVDGVCCVGQQEKCEGKRIRQTGIL